MNLSDNDYYRKREAEGYLMSTKQPTSLFDEGLLGELAEHLGADTPVYNESLLARVYALIHENKALKERVARLLLLGQVAVDGAANPGSVSAQMQETLAQVFWED